MSDDGSLPVVQTPSASRGDGGDVWGVVLAAGTSSRYGDRNKLLEAIDGEPMVRQSVKPLLATDLAGVVVVVGHEAPAVTRAIEDLDVDTVENEAYAVGQSTSVATGIEAVANDDADAVVVALGDMPFVAPATIDALLAVHQQTAYDALAAAFDRKRGNPVLFDSSVFDALTDLEGDVGGRDVLVESGNAALVETGDPGVRRDIDEPSDRPDSDPNSPLDD